MYSYINYEHNGARRAARSIVENYLKLLLLLAVKSILSVLFYLFFISHQLHRLYAGKTLVYYNVNTIFTRPLFILTGDNVIILIVYYRVTKKLLWKKCVHQEISNKSELFSQVRFDMNLNLKLMG